MTSRFVSEHGACITLKILIEAGLSTELQGCYQQCLSQWVRTGKPVFTVDFAIQQANIHTI